MTKIQDIPFKERWPTLYKIRFNWLIKISFPIFGVWTLYIGLNLFINHALGWPMNQPLVPDMTYQAYQNYVHNQEQSAAVMGPLLGSMFLILGGWFTFKVSRLFRRREVEEEA